jgi:Ni,Fe-hydrogenase III large subunit
VDRWAQPPGQEGREARGKDHQLLFADEEPVAQPDRAQVDARGKRRVMETTGLLSAYELAERVCSAFGCPHHEHLSLPEKVA